MSKLFNSKNILFTIYIFIYCIVVGLLFILSRSDWMIANGSDSLAAIYRLSITQQIIALVSLPVFIGILAIVFRYFMIRANQILFCTLITVFAVFVLFLAYNSLTINEKDGLVTQTWVIWHYNKLPYGGARFPDGVIHVNGTPPFITFSNNAGEKKMFFFGIPPFDLKKEVIYDHPSVMQNTSNLLH